MTSNTDLYRFGTEDSALINEDGKIFTTTLKTDEDECRHFYYDWDSPEGLHILRRAKRKADQPVSPRPKNHNCEDHPVPYKSDGPIGHGWECGICGAFLQAG